MHAPAETVVSRIVWAAIALFGGVAAISAQPVDVELIAQVGQTTPQSGGDPISSLNSPFTTGTGQVGFTGAVARASGTDNFVWFDTGIVWFNSSAAPGNVITGAEGTMGTGDAGEFVYSPSVDGEDSVWTQDGLLLRADDPAPGAPGQFSSFNSRPQMLPDGTAVWVGGLTNAIGGATQARALFRAADTATPVITIVLQSGDMVGGFPIDFPSGVAFDYQFSDDGAHHIQTLLLDTGSTTNDDVVYVDGSVVARELSPVPGGLPGENWDNFDNVSINSAGDYLFSGDTDGATGTDEFLAHGGAIVLREGDVVDGVTLTAAAAVQAAAINDLGQAVFIWSVAGGAEHLFFAADASNPAAAVRLLSTGDLVDVDDDTIADFEVDDFNASTAIGPGLDLAENGFVYVEVDLLPAGQPLGGALESIVRLGLPVPNIAVTPPSHDYGAVTVGVTTSQSFTVENVGDADLNVSSTVIDGDPDFQIVAGGGAFVLAPGATEIIDVEFTPASAGAKSAELEIASDDPDTPLLAVALSGEGTPPAAPNIAVAPPAHDFGALDLGAAATQGFVVENTGDASLDVTSSQITGADAAEFQIVSGGGAFTLAPGAQQVIDVEFAPGSAGPKSAALEIASNDADSPLVVVALTGEGVEGTTVLEIPVLSPAGVVALVMLLLGVGLRALRRRSA
jgi:hypothetical protein